MYCRPVGRAQHPSGIVAHVVLDENTAHTQDAQELLPRVPLPSLVGSGPPWLHACQEIERIFRSGEWLAVEGEPGVGKVAVLRAVQLRRQPVGRFGLIDSRDAAGDPDWLQSVRRLVLGDAETVVIRHVDTLSDATLRGLASTLQDARANRTTPLWVAVTLRNSEGHGKALQQLMRLFPSSVEIPPLRLHLEDLPLLVPAFLSRLGQGGHLAASPEAVRLLMRMSWPGNAEQLHELLREVVKHRRTGVIQPADLPPEVHAVTRRVLSPLEALERDAIVKCLSEANGNKVQAARSLGMSRASIYRKIRDYGIVPPSS